jgi:hypothetical protein
VQVRQRMGFSVGLPADLCIFSMLLVSLRRSRIWSLMDKSLYSVFVGPQHMVLCRTAPEWFAAAHMVLCRTAAGWFAAAHMVLCRTATG